MAKRESLKIGPELKGQINDEQDRLRKAEGKRPTFEAILSRMWNAYQSSSGEVHLLPHHGNPNPQYAALQGSFAKGVQVKPGNHDIDMLLDWWNNPQGESEEALRRYVKSVLKDRKKRKTEEEKK